MVESSQVMNKRPPQLLLLVGFFLLSLFFASCSQHPLTSESGLYDVKLEHSWKAPVDGAWVWGKGSPFAKQKRGYIYVAPLDISKVVEDEPELAPLMVPQMHAYVVEELSSELRKNYIPGKQEWQLTFDPKQADIRIDMALVHFRPQNPFLRLFSGIGSLFSPVPGVGTVAGRFAEGDICIEIAIRNNHNGELLAAFKDSNREKTRLYKSDAYSRSGNADANLRAWARGLARLFEEGCRAMREGKTLLQRFQERTVGDAIRVRMD